MTTDPNSSGGHARLIPAGGPPGSSKPFFAFNPVLAVHSGSWVFSRSPGLGTALLLAGAAVSLLDLSWLVADVLVIAPDRDWNQRFIIAFIGLVVAFVLIVFGRELRRGKVRDAQTGKRIAQDRFNLSATPDFGDQLHAGLASGSLEQRQLRSGGNRKGGWRLDCFVRVYRFPGSSRVIATVHHVSDEGVRVWPPVELSPEYADRLTVRRYSSSHVSYD